MQNLQTIFGYLAPLLAFALGIGLLVYKMRREKQSALDADEGAADVAQTWQRIKALLNMALPDIITDAENKYLDPGTGELKMSYAVAQIMSLIPPEWRGHIQDDDLQGFIETALESTRVIWADLPRVLHRERIAQSRAELEAEAAVTVPPAVIAELQDRRLHLELAVNGCIIAMPDTPADEETEQAHADEADAADEPTPKGKHKKLLTAIVEPVADGTALEEGTPCGLDTQGEPGEPGVPDEPVEVADAAPAVGSEAAAAQDDGGAQEEYTAEDGDE